MNKTIYIVTSGGYVYSSGDNCYIDMSDTSFDNYEEANYFSLITLKNFYKGITEEINLSVNVSRMNLTVYEKINFYDISLKLKELEKTNPEFFI